MFSSKITGINKLDKTSVMLRLALPPNDSDTSEFGKHWSGKSTLNEWEKQRKKITTIYLTDDIKENQKRLDLIRYEARKIKYTCDTNTIVKVHFIQDNTYGQFVKLVNMMIEDQHERYFYYQDDFYILGEPPLDSSYNIITLNSLPEL